MQLKPLSQQTPRCPAALTTDAVVQAPTWLGSVGAQTQPKGSAEHIIAVPPSEGPAPEPPAVPAPSPPDPPTPSPPAPGPPASPPRPASLPPTVALPAKPPLDSSSRQPACHATAIATSASALTPPSATALGRFPRVRLLRFALFPLDLLEDLLVLNPAGLDLLVDLLDRRDRRAALVDPAMRQDLDDVGSGHRRQRLVQRRLLIRRRIGVQVDEIGHQHALLFLADLPGIHLRQALQQQIPGLGVG